MQWNWQEMWQHMGLPALIVAGVLATMGFASLLVFVERMLLFTRAKSQRLRFLQAVAEDLAAGRFERAAEVAQSYPGSPVARVIGAALQTHIHALRHHGAGSLSPVEKTQRHMERYIEQLGAELRRGFAVLSAVGSTAPFVGLLGTVLGIITAFQGIAESGSGGLSGVSAGIAEALVETALGLVVAIPAVLAFNFLTTRANAEETAVKNALGEILDRLEDLEDARPVAVASGANPVRPDRRPAWESYAAAVEVAG